MRTRKVLEEVLYTSDFGTNGLPELAIKFNTSVIAELLLDIRDLLDNKKEE